jgi:hypothetical protein
MRYVIFPERTEATLTTESEQLVLTRENRVNDADSTSAKGKKLVRYVRLGNRILSLSTTTE